MYRQASTYPCALLRRRPSSLMPRKQETVVPSRQGCQCIKREGDDVFGDIREGTCQSCGHQVPGHKLPARQFGFSIGSGVDRSTSARKRKRFGGAA